MQYDPFKILLTVDDQSWPEDKDVYSDAMEQFNPENPEPLAKLLSSSDIFIARSGLHVFGELGKKAFPLLEFALVWVSHPHMMARNALLNGVLCYSTKLTPEQAQKVLTLADDPEDLVREKVITFIGASKNSVIQKAINLIPNKDIRSQHLAALDAVPSKITNIQKLFDNALSIPLLHSTYTLAAIERAAWEDKIDLAPIYAGDKYIGKAVAWNTARIIRRNVRRKLRRQ